MDHLPSDRGGGSVEGGEEEGFNSIFSLFNFLFPLVPNHRIKMLKARELSFEQRLDCTLESCQGLKKRMYYLFLLPWTP